MNIPTLHLRSLSATLLILLCAGHPVLADDTEVLIGAGNQANVLFIMDTSGSMADNIAGNTPATGESSRLQIVQGVFADLMRNPAYQGFNVALMRFDKNGHGGYFVTPMQALNTSTQDSIIAESNAFIANGNTPLSETLYEAARYWRGMTVDYGDSSSPGINVSAVMDADATLSTYVDNSAHYISPITSQCQKNYTILLTDGAPNGDNEANTSVQNDLLGGTACVGGGNGGCLDDIANYLYTTDLSPGANGITGRQYAETYTIGFTTNQTLLEATAMAGGGTANANGIGNDHYFTASSATALANAFTDALSGITASEGSFTAPALAANAFNGISHNNRLYFALFKPDTKPKWDGNVKPYELNDTYNLVDAAGGNVIDGNGAFVAGSRSFWANSADGGSIAEGGANGRLPAASTRKLYTYTGNYSSSGVPDVASLTTSTNLLTDTNDSLIGLIGLPSTLTTSQETAQRGVIINTARASKLGAPLHSQPALVTYGGADAAHADLTLFVATNDGFLHALNASPNAEGTTDGGKELFAFIPKELLPNLPILANNGGAHPYGLDGDISVWVKEDPNDADVTIDTSAGSTDHVYVYVGMRRGGNNYYALDVTDRTAPTLKWVIRGGAGGTPGFEELGQTWSKPTLTTIKYGTGTGTKKVLIFGGGYDPAQDANPLNNVPGNEDSIGRAIFIVDADTGEKLWQAGPAASNPTLTIPEMTHSIPSDVRLLDSNLDGNTDRLYVGDMRGQIFRIDLQATTTGVTGSGIRLANLGGLTEADNRRFFYPPDVVMTQHRGSTPYISVNIGSGYRAHPLNPATGARVNDRFYSLRDPYVVGPIPTGTTVASISNSDLFDATSTPVLSSQQSLDLSSSSASGWFITLGAGNGEKVLAPSITLNGEIYFTTYTPPASTTNTNCEPPSGSGRLYHVNLFDATPVIPQAGVSAGSTPPTPTVGDRVTNLERPGIPPAPSAMFRKTTDGVEIILCVGTECDDLPNAIHMQETYWKDDS